MNEHADGVSGRVQMWGDLSIAPHFQGMEAKGLGLLRRGARSHHVVDRRAQRPRGTSRDVAQGFQQCSSRRSAPGARDVSGFGADRRRGPRLIAEAGRNSAGPVHVVRSPGRREGLLETLIRVSPVNHNPVRRPPYSRPVPGQNLVPLRHKFLLRPVDPDTKSSEGVIFLQPSGNEVDLRTESSVAWSSGSGLVSLSSL